MVDLSASVTATVSKRTSITQTGRLSGSTAVHRTGIRSPIASRPVTMMRSPRPSGACSSSNRFDTRYGSPARWSTRGASASSNSAIAIEEVSGARLVDCPAAAGGQTASRSHSRLIQKPLENRLSESSGIFASAFAGSSGLRLEGKTSCKICVAASKRHPSRISSSADDGPPQPKGRTSSKRRPARSVTSRSTGLPAA